MKLSRPVFIVGARRSPIGRFGGGLAALSAADLALQVAEAAVPESLRAAIENVIVGQVLSAGTGMNVARQIGLRLGLSQTTPALTVNMVCGSGLRAVALGSQEIILGESEIVLTGGVESMSNAPHYCTKTRFGNKLGDTRMLDGILADGLTDPLLGISMGETAENIAASHGIDRAAQDAFAACSQKKAAQAAKAFEREISPISVARGTVSADEQPRAETSVEGLARLRAAFKPEGTVTAGNSSTINDGAAMVVLASEDACHRHDLIPLARIVAHTVTGCDPNLMGLGPVNAVLQLCEELQWSADEVDAIELNEAFAVQSLACIQELNLSPEKVNQRGGAIALGHPIGASGARILVTLIHLMQDKDYRRGIATLCVGGGMGIAMGIERPG